MTGEYWVFKYVEDLARQETRNIGVVLKTDAGVVARFLGERDGGGALDLRTVRGVVRHTPTYKQWVDYWRHCLQESASADAARDRLLQSLRGNFISSERSTVSLPDVAPSEAVSYLFHSLVTEFPSPRADEFSLAARVDEIITAYALKQSPHFQEAPVVECRLDAGIVEHVRPHFGWVNGHAVYFQKVSINPLRLEPTQRDVHNAAWIFEKLRASTDADTKALIKLTGYGDALELAARRQADEYVQLLRRLSTEVIDVDDEGQVDHGFRALVPV